ncbi:MAG TPA: trypsin-like peptidase domain-containing protein [Actinoplanes sp.]
MITDVGVVGGGSTAPEPAEPPERTPRRWNRPDMRRKLLFGVVLLWALAITAAVLLRNGGDAGPSTAASPAPAPSASDAPLSVPEVYRALLPSVVRIEADGEGRTDTESAIGTGVIVNANGTILTAAHVVAGADTITVAYADGTRSRAIVARANAQQDIAMLTPAKLPETVVPAALGGGVAVGDDVVAIGNPLGLTASTTNGVVSGLDRGTRGESGAMTGLIQFDAAVNPGSSGGPLINDKAQVVGIVVALANPTSAGTFIGIGFAVPIGAALGAGTGDGQAPPL